MRSVAGSQEGAVQTCRQALQPNDEQCQGTLGYTHGYGVIMHCGEELSTASNNAQLQPVKCHWES